MTSTISATARLQLNFTAGRCQATRIQHVQLNFKDGKFGVIRQRPFYLSKSHTVKSSPSHKASPAPPLKAARKRDREDDEIDTIETLSLGLARKRDREDDEIDTIETLSLGLAHRDRASGGDMIMTAKERKSSEFVLFSTSTMFVCLFFTN